MRSSERAVFFGLLGGSARASPSADYRLERPLAERDPHPLKMHALTRRTEKSEIRVRYDWDLQPLLMPVKNCRSCEVVYDGRAMEN